MIRALTSCGLLWLLLAGGVWAQRGGRGGGRGNGPNFSGMGGAQPHPRRDALERWNQMTPAERQRALAKLPPERQRQIRERIERFNRLPRAERQQLRERYQQFLQLPPEKQDMVRRDIGKFMQLPDERRQTLSKEFEQLRGLPESERQTRLNSEEFKNKYNPEERQMLGDLSGVLAAPPKQAPAK
ncbi:MAG TPA: DUF3106 domain-containing protein [Bryobacteraceae bacterium]|nr:DUF3106 domain-containing protein [Bryobacteraceae bacterium]